MFFPKGTPRDLVVRWNAEVNKVLADPAFVEKILSRQAMTPTGGSPDDLRRVLEAKRVLGAELAKIANLKYD